MPFASAKLDILPNGGSLGVNDNRSLTPRLHAHQQVKCDRRLTTPDFAQAGWCQTGGKQEVLQFVKLCASKTMQPEALVNTPYVNSPLNVVIMFTCFFAIIWGIIFKSKLEYEVGRWDANRATQERIEYRRPGLVIAYVLTSFFALIFFYCCLLLIALPTTLAAAVSVAVIGLTSVLLWFQTGSLLQMLVEGGSQAIDIDFIDMTPEDIIGEGDVQG